MARKQTSFLLVVPVLLLLAITFVAVQISAQSVQADLFVPVGTIGANRPNGLRYDPNFDRFAWVDAQGQLVIVNAASQETERVLYPSGSFADFTFSNNGELFAVALDVRVDVWDVASGTLVAQFEPAGARRVQGPLQFTRNDELLVVDSIVPAPQELRRSENDTVILPWVWDIAAARDQRNSVLVNRVAAYPFYNIRASMIAGDNGVLVAGLDNRIQIYDADTPSLQMVADVSVSRLETDPIHAWRSATDPYLYVALDNYGRLMQVNTLTDETTIINLGNDLDAAGIAHLKTLAASRAQQSLGARTSAINPLASLLYGSDYVERQDYNAAQMNLIDVLIPLTDDPQRVPASDTALLVYNFNEAYGFGSVDMLHPSGVNQLALSPDTQQIALRWQSGAVEIYAVASGALLRRFTPSEPDPEGRRTFAYSGDGAALLVDFERFDAATGERLARVPQYTQPFESYLFNDDDQLITFGGTRLSAAESEAVWRLWDAQTGQLLREDSFAINAESVLDNSPDRLRYLAQSSADDGGLDLLIIDARANSSDTIHLPRLPDAGITQVVPNADWSRFLVVYGGSSGNPLAVYDRTGARLYFDAGNNLPANAFSYEWRDDETISISAYTSAAASQPVRGLVYAPSGLPQCIVNALPDGGQALVPVWERVVYYTPVERLNDLTLRLCAALTGEGAHNVSAAEGTPAIAPNVTAVATLLTPSPTVEYRSARTPAPIAVPGVPTCITTLYRSQAAAYAELWRQITADVTDPQQLADINDMICEGLLSSLSGVQATPTINPNSLAVTTATPLPDAPQTTGGDENRFDVLTIDLRTGARTLANDYVVPPTPEQIDGMALLVNFYRDQYRTYPTDPAVSPDGRYFAARNASGFVTIYRLTRALPELVQEEASARATRAAQVPRSLGLAPTPSQPSQALGAALPTLTPTVTLTPIPFAQTTADLPQMGDTQAICPARQLAQIPDLPDGFAPPGQLIVAPISGGNAFLWTLDPISGKLVGNQALPQCNVNEGCAQSPDGLWVARQQYPADGSAGAVIVSRIDGTDARVLYSAAEVQSVSPSYRWIEPHMLVISYNGILATRSPNPTTLYSTYDPDTGVRTVGQLQATTAPLGLLPFDVVARQPYGTLELLAEYFAGGARYYLRDTVSGATTLFAQDLTFWSWQPAGRFLYYRSRDNISYQYDSLTQTYTQLKEGLPPDGTWSPNGHLLARWSSITMEAIQQTLSDGDLPPRIEVWNSDTGLTYTYCLPELSKASLDGSLTWSPDSRYLAFVVNLPFDGDLAPTPTFAISPEAPPATSTSIPLEAQYQQQFPRTIVLDTATGNTAMISDEVSSIESWIVR